MSVIMVALIKGKRMGVFQRVSLVALVFCWFVIDECDGSAFGSHFQVTRYNVHFNGMSVPSTRNVPWLSVKSDSEQH